MFPRTFVFFVCMRHGSTRSLSGRSPFCPQSNRHKRVYDCKLRLFPCRISTFISCVSAAISLPNPHVGRRERRRASEKNLSEHWRRVFRWNLNAQIGPFIFLFATMGVPLGGHGFQSGGLQKAKDANQTWAMGCWLETCYKLDDMTAPTNGKLPASSYIDGFI